MGHDTTTLHLDDGTKRYGLIYTVTDVSYSPMFKTKDLAWHWYRTVVLVAKDLSTAERSDRAEIVVTLVKCGHVGEEALLSYYERDNDGTIVPVRFCQNCNLLQVDGMALYDHRIPKFENITRARDMRSLWFATRAQFNAEWSETEIENVVSAFEFCEEHSLGSVLDHMQGNGYPHEFITKLASLIKAADGNSPSNRAWDEFISRHR